VEEISKEHISEWSTKAAQEAFDLIKSNILSQPPQQPKMVDLGCGNGSLMQRCQQLGFTVVGVDVSEIALRICREKGLPVVQHDLNQFLPFKDKEFDLIACVEVVEHLFNPAAFLGETRRVLKDNGFLVISAPNEYEWLQRLRFLLGKPIDWQPWSATTHLHKSSLGQFAGFLTEEGWDINRLRPFMLSGSAHLPVRLQKILISLFPNLFAGYTIAMVRKRK